MDIGPETFAANLTVQPGVLPALKGFLLHDAATYPNAFFLGKARSARLPLTAELDRLDLGAPSGSARRPTHVDRGDLAIPIFRDLGTSFRKHVQQWYALWPPSSPAASHFSSFSDAPPVAFVASTRDDAGDSCLVLRSCTYVPGARLRLFQVEPLRLAKLPDVLTMSSVPSGAVVRDALGRLACVTSVPATGHCHLVGVWCAVDAAAAKENSAAVLSGFVLRALFSFFFSHVVAPNTAAGDDAQPDSDAPSFLFVLLDGKTRGIRGQYEVSVRSLSGAGEWRMHDVSRTVEERTRRRSHDDRFDDFDDDDGLSDWLIESPQFDRLMAGGGAYSPMYGDAHPDDSSTAASEALYDARRYRGRR